MGLEMDGAGIRRAGHEGDGPRVLQIAHVDDADAVRIAVADIGIASMHHNLDAVATPALVGVADELDIAGCHRIHGSILPYCAAPRTLTAAAVHCRTRAMAGKVPIIKQPLPRSFDQQHIVRRRWSGPGNSV